MKKLLSLVFASVLLVSSISCNVLADDFNQPQSFDYAVGDVNCDTEIDNKDYLCIRKVLAKERFSYMAYENADLNGDAECNLKDVLYLRKYLVNADVKLNDKKFFLEDENITGKLCDLGKNNFDNTFNPWNDSSTANTLSRNPFDMISLGYRVLVSGGNYENNTGPVKISYYTIDQNKSRTAGTLDTEQVNKFYYYDDMCFALAIDPKSWGAANVYVLKPGGYSFTTKHDVLSRAIHCYDMTKYNDTYFFVGSAISYDSNYKNYSGENLEMSKSIAYRFTGSDITQCTKSDFKEIEVIDKNGNVIDYTTNIMERKKSDGSVYYTRIGVPRFYDIFEWQDNIYALFYDQYRPHYSGVEDINGIYKYDAEKDQFIYDADLKIDAITELFEENQDKEKLNHDFCINGKYYLMSGKTIVTEDFKNYSNFVIPNYENYDPHDIIKISGKYYLLCSGINENGNYTNYVLETEDMESFRPILHFTSATYAKSFEFCNGAFFFGLGARLDENNNVNSECGRILRYNYYK